MKVSLTPFRQTACFITVCLLFTASSSSAAGQPSSPAAGRPMRPEVQATRLQAQPTGAERHAGDRIAIAHARPVSNGRPAVSTAPTVSGPPILQVGFLEDVGHRCGPVCDCDGLHGGRMGRSTIGLGLGPDGGTEAACGIEWIEPRHSLGAGCGMEASCGLESCSTCRGEPLFGSDVSLLGEVACGADGGFPCDCDGCVAACEFDRLPLCLPLLRVNWCRFDFFAGVQGYTGPMNLVAADGGNDAVRSGTGSFGFYQGFNEGRSLRRFLGIDLAAQFGLRATQSNLSGTEFTNDTRQQVFVTGGFFRRVDYGLQYGVVVDYLNEDWYFQADLTQLRGELSWRTRRSDEFGFQFMTDLGGEQSATLLRDVTGNRINSTASLEATDQYRFFYRWRLRGEGSWSVFGGWSEDKHGLLGTQIDLPLMRQVALQTGFTYLVPDDALGQVDHRSEAWNVSLGLVLRPGGPRRGVQRYSTPLLSVADNGTFVLRRR